MFGQLLLLLVLASGVNMLLVVVSLPLRENRGLFVVVSHHQELVRGLLIVFNLLFLPLFNCFQSLLDDLVFEYCIDHCFCILMSKITDNHSMHCISERLHQVYQNTVEVIIVRLILVFDLGNLDNKVSYAKVLEQTLG